MQEQFINFHGKILRTGFINNQFGVAFKEIYLISNGNTHISKSYLCLNCGKLFISKYGARCHSCILHIQQQKELNAVNRHRSAMEYILRYIATSNVSYRSMDNDNLRLALSFIDPSFQFPRRTTIRNDMIELAKKIRKQTISELFGKSASLLFDSCKRWGVNYQGVIIYTSTRLYLWSAIATQDSTSQTLAQVISSVVKTLKFYGINIISVCTDNCNANKRALNGDFESAQGLSDQHFIRQPCSAHTNNLAIEDVFKTDEEFGFVSDYVQFLMNHAPKASYREGFKPKYISIRWLSLSNCVSFIVKYMTLYRQTRLKSVLDALERIESKIGWNNLLTILSIMVDFTNAIQTDLSSIADIPPHYFAARFKLLSMQSSAAHRVAAYLEFRFTHTCPLQLPLFAYLMTKSGLEYIKENQLECIVDAASDGMVGYMIQREFPVETIISNKISFYYYINNFDSNSFDGYINAVDFWNNYLFNNRSDQITISFIKLVTEVLQIPSSESAVERLFSSLSKIVSCENCNVTPITLDSRLMVKFDSIFGRAGSVTLRDISDNPEKNLKLGKF
ncbi:hypothetical protein M9Y10_028650 [Tritrichomonas musculus]|uniref:C2H2-type domain-containing protein n=1 Tax=Tritrichomonas musculus TaxID=1915356 RepID=A0ABR2KL23_9EUKA